MKIKEKIKRIFGKLKTTRGAGSSGKTVFQPPEKGMGRAQEIVGTLFRGAAVFCGLFGTIHLLYESVGLYDPEQLNTRFQYISVPFMLLVSFVFALLTAVATYNRITKTVVPIVTLGALFGFAAMRGDPITLFENAARRLYNGVVEGMFYAGYRSFSAFFLSEDYSFDPGKVLVRWSAVLVAAVLSVLFYLCVTRRTWIILYSLTISLVLVPVCFFNIALGTLGFAFIVASVAGFIAMRIVDTRYGGRLGKRLDRKEAARQKRERRREEKYERKVARLRLKNTAKRVYDKAIDTEMGLRRARQAKRSVISRVKRDRKLKKRLERRDAAREKRQRLTDKKEARKAKKLEARNSARLRREAIAAEGKMPPEMKRRARAERLEREASMRREAKAARRLAAKNKREARREVAGQRRRNRAASGFAGFAAAVIAIIAGVIPFTAAKNPFPTIGFIDDRIRPIREKVTDILLGDSVDLTEDPYSDVELFGYETLTFEARKKSDLQIFVVEAPTNMPLYLKSRTALDFDIRTD
ncbi:MAG: hypothetical protein IJQ80_00445, partial [Clostridia bacterium]|nr:hypothetical protein [Clostridia bacterium]